MDEQQWEVDIHIAAVSVMTQLPSQWLQPLRKLMHDLKRGIFSPKSIKIIDVENTYAITLEDYRITYQIQEEKRRVKIALIDLTFNKG